MKIVVVVLGYVGLSNAGLLALHNEVIDVDILNERVNALNKRQSPILDMGRTVAQKKLNSRYNEEDQDKGASSYCVRT